ncbi:cell division protein FtsK [Bacillus sp. FJAT-27231]|uniref:DNA translocase FtsK n=1 Tax=Bacillus sp. FJAT-27231 TaxID=1679168 RepID=UPI00067156A0|nr:DNA translocase FtsK [Bacillus sp. FJAT-27231]KMY53668.1 cell division protein FtsK [Bacillus sp. FJAT-27231]
MANKKKKKSSKRTKKSAQIKEAVKLELLGIIIIALSLIGIIRLGVVGTAFVYFFRFFFGQWYMIGFIAAIAYGMYIMVKRKRPLLFRRKQVGLYVIIISLLLFNHVELFEQLGNGRAFKEPSVMVNTWELYREELKEGITDNDDLGGGMIGAILFAVSYFLFDTLGTKILSFVLVMIGLILITGRSFGEIFGKLLSSGGKNLKKQWAVFLQDMKDWKSERKSRRTERADRDARTSDVLDEPPSHVEKDERSYSAPEPIISSFTERAYQEEPELVQEQQKEAVKPAPDAEKEAGEDRAPAMTFTEVENKDYQLPSINLLTRPKQTDQSREYKQIHANAAKLERTFQSFGVKAKVTQVHLGPAVTKYEVHPDIGVKVSKIVSLSDDLALALAAKDIRMEAPIPGKSAIGIEVPNSEVAMVSLREVLEANANEKPDSKLLIAFGRDITGEAVSAELNKMPHLLVAGATGSGKSVCINGIITSILMRAKPHEVKLMMIDPKMVELNVYNGIPHLLAPVVTDAKKASQALKKVVGEMERRYDLFSHSGTRNIEGYNTHVKRHNEETGEKQPLLPYIVVIVDELADLMMVASSDVEDSITRLAQMARAAGIHLIIATQRPSVDVITGVIKANIPSRIAFAVSSMTDSRTILDMGGAEKLLGRGDMLFFPSGASKPVRVQGAFLSDEEVEEIVDYVISQQKAQYQEDMIPEDTPEATTEVEDELYEEAVQLVADMQTASVSMLQRRFRIGYSRAARLIDEMEMRGIVGPYEGSKPRTVLIAKQAEEHMQ